VDKRYAPFEVIGLEKRYGLIIPVKIIDHEIQIRVGGVIDRIDRKEGVTRILDYKTGRDKLDFQGIDALFNAPYKNRNRAVLQTILYGLIYLAEEKTAHVKPALYLIQQIFASDFSWDIIDKNGKNNIQVHTIEPYTETFYAYLKEVLTALFHPESDFVQTDDPDVCNQCPYAGICHK